MVNMVYCSEKQKRMKAEISPVFPIDIDISKSIVVKLTHKEYVECVEQKNGKIKELNSRRFLLVFLVLSILP